MPACARACLRVPGIALRNPSRAGAAVRVVAGARHPTPAAVALPHVPLDGPVDVAAIAVPKMAVGDIACSALSAHRVAKRVVRPFPSVPPPVSCRTGARVEAWRMFVAADAVVVLVDGPILHAVPTHRVCSWAERHSHVDV